MKFLKISGIIVLILILLIMMLSYLAPDSMNMERSKIIDVPQEETHDYLRQFSNFDNWSPWNDLDPNIRTSIEGEDGMEGAIYKWEGNEKVGSGKQELVSITGDRIDIRITFLEPWESTADVYYLIKDQNGKSEVTWGMSSELSFPFNLMSWFINMEESIGSQYEKGLANLQESLDEEKGLFPEKPFGPKTFLVYRDEAHMNNLIEFFTGILPDLRASAEEKDLNVGSTSWGIYYDSWRADEGGWIADVGVALKVLGDERPEFDAFTYDTIEAQALKGYHKGNYHLLGQVHADIQRYAIDIGYTPIPPLVEEYVVSAEDTAEPNAWETDVWMFYTE